jgi:hypothetical protein
VPVLAHPRSPGYEVADEVISALTAAGLAGLEVYHPDHDQAERDRLLSVAGSLDLVPTGGSDDHGAFSNTGLGSQATPAESFERIAGLATGDSPYPRGRASQYPRPQS